MEVKEKLVEIIQNSVGGCARNWAEIIADGLIAHGVTLRDVPETDVGKWISVKNSLPENDSRIVKNLVGEDFGFLTVLVYNGVVKQTNRYFSREPIYGLPKTNGWEWATFNVTHWMPLPRLPKGE